MGTRDRYGNAIDETVNGNCVFDPFSSILHFVFDVVPYIADKQEYNQVHCCMRQKGVASGSSGDGSSSAARKAKKECQREISQIRRLGFEPNYCASARPSFPELVYEVSPQPGPNPYD
jgi:hypothetical protein